MPRGGLNMSEHGRIHSCQIGFPLRMHQSYVADWFEPPKTWHLIKELILTTKWQVHIIFFLLLKFSVRFSHEMCSAFSVKAIPGLMLCYIIKKKNFFQISANEWGLWIWTEKSSFMLVTAFHSCLKGIMCALDLIWFRLKGSLPLEKYTTPAGCRVFPLWVRLYSKTV